MYFILLPFIILLTACTSTPKKRFPSSEPEQVKLLHIGDSHSAGRFGELMHETYQNSFAESNLYAYVGSAPFHWTQDNARYICSSSPIGRHNENGNINLQSNACNQGRSRVFQRLLDQHNPDLIVFQFLGNSIPRSSSKDNNQHRRWVRADINKMLNLLNENQKCVFITSPPYEASKHTTMRDEYEEIFREEAQSHNCCVISVIKDDSISMEEYQEYYSSDRKHLSSSGATFFADYVSEKLETLSSQSYVCEE